MTEDLKASIMKVGSLGKLEPAPTEPLAETSVVAEVAKLDCLKRTARATLARPFEGHGATTTFFEITRDMLGQEFSAAAVTVALGRLGQTKGDRDRERRGRPRVDHLSLWQHHRRDGVADLA